MTIRRSILALAVASLFCVTSLAGAAIELTEVVSGLSSPVFVGHAGDGSNRLFIVERGGTIRVLQPGASSPNSTPFLDITMKVVSGNEQGLLGLAFHPLYASNRRFFVFYTKAGDGALVIAEYAASTGSPDVADPTEKALLTIPHSTNTNHNGGMLAFGRDGFLYIGVGDGGGSYDVPHNAQNTSVLLGKILRIDVDHPDTVRGTLYSVPPDNPFAGQASGREIFAYGFRNPWRFSFDRLTDQQWVGDVGQDTREEVDTSIVNGGNYGWRVYEGSFCTGRDPGLCGGAGFIPPILEWDHTTFPARCSVTGGYVYRGSMGAVTSGTYLYGDFCSGEILSWNGSSQTVLLDTALNISSFGEDEAGEVYVVSLGGTLSKIVPAGQPPPTCTYAISPTRATFGASGGTGTVVVTAPTGCTWTATRNATWITITGGASGNGNGTVTYSVAPYTGKPKNRNGSATIALQTFSVKQSR